MAKKKKIRKNVIRGIAHVTATFNNTIITITDVNGETLAWDSAGTVGFKGARKATPFAATRAAEKCANKVKRMGMREVEVHVKGPEPDASPRSPPCSRTDSTSPPSRITLRSLTTVVARARSVACDAGRPGHVRGAVRRPIDPFPTGKKNT